MRLYDIPLIILIVICVLIPVGYYIAKCCRRMNEFNFVQFVGWKQKPSQPQTVSDPESNVPSTSDDDLLNNSQSVEPTMQPVNCIRNRTTVGFENNGYLEDSNEVNKETFERDRSDSRETNSTTESAKESRLSDLRETLLQAGVQAVTRSNSLQCFRDPGNNYAGPEPTAASSLDNEQNFAGEILNIPIPRYVGFSSDLNNETENSPTLNPPGLYYLPRSFHAAPFVRPTLNGIRRTLNGQFLNLLGLRLYNGLGLGEPILNGSGREGFNSDESSSDAPVVLMPEHMDEILFEGENLNPAVHAAIDDLINTGEAGSGEAGSGEAGSGEAGSGEARLTDSSNLYTASSSENLSTYCLDADSLSTDSVFI